MELFWEVFLLLLSARIENGRDRRGSSRLEREAPPRGRKLMKNQRKGDRKRKLFRKRPLELTFGGLGSPWEVQKELSGATVDIDPTSAPLSRGGVCLPTSLRLGDSEDLRRRSEATKDLTRRLDGEFYIYLS